MTNEWSSQELNEMLNRWDQTDPKIQRGIVAKLTERAAKWEKLHDKRTEESKVLEKTRVLIDQERERLTETNHRLRAALLPFAAAAGRPGRLKDCMTDNPLADDAVLALGVKVAAWKRAIELTGAD